MIKRMIHIVEALLVFFILAAIGCHIYINSFDRGFEDGVLYGGLAIMEIKQGTIPPPPDYMSDSEAIEYLTIIARQKYESGIYE